MRKIYWQKVTSFLSNVYQKKSADFEKLQRRLAFLCCFFIGISVHSGTAQDFKVVGYLPSYRFHLTEKVDYYKMTHVCLSFANPDSFGNLSFAKNADPKPVIRDAHAAGVKVFLSLAGGGLEPAWERAWTKLQQPYARANFIQKIIDYALIHGFQGIDVDLEWDSVGPFYSDFVVELGAQLQFYNLEMTAALPGIHRYPEISDEALQAFDWINVMAYDLTGPWNPAKAGQHAPFSMAVESIDYWLNQNVPANKLNLGVPFYGFDFSNKRKVASASFGDLTKQNVNFAQLDQVGKTYYNGIPTIKAKTAWALKNAGGVMIWEIGQDCFNGNSLLSVIFKEKMLQVIPEVEVLVEEIPESAPIIEEPFPDEIIEAPLDVTAQLTKYDSWEVLPAAKGRFVLLDVGGRELFSQPLESKETLKINTGFLLNGIGFYKIFVEGALVSQGETVKLNE